MKRVYIESLSHGINPLSKEESHHIHNVLKLQKDNAVQAFDGKGNVANGVIYDISKIVSVNIEKEIEHINEQSTRIHAFVSFPKGNRADFMIQKLTELGITSVQPLITERTVVIPSASKINRLRQICIEACKQSHEPYLPILNQSVRIHKVQLYKNSSRNLLFHGLPHSIPLNTNIIKEFNPDEIYFFIGPEGGFTEEELTLLTNMGSTPYAIGNNILRIETAAISTMAILSQHREKNDT